MRIDVVSLFPQAFTGVFEHSIISRATAKKVVDIQIHNLRNYGLGKHKTVDDTPYGGGAGMLLKIDVLVSCLEDIQKQYTTQKPTTILLSSSGNKYTQQTAQDLSSLEWLVVICGHYEGVDERILNYVDLELSIGDFVLSGGEIPAMVVVDSLVRLIPGVLGAEESLKQESFSISGKQSHLVEYPQYTRPEDFRGLKVPEVLLNGNHKEIQSWREEQSITKTKLRRPDLLK